MNFKRYHVSKNLFYKKISGANINTEGKIIVNGDFDLVVAKVTEGETYSVSGVSAIMGFYVNEPELNSSSYNNQRETIVSPVTIPQGVNYVAYRVNARPNVAMLNTGSTPLPYEPYGNTWTDSHYIKGTDTDTITTLPAVIYPTGTTATVGLKGQTVQSSIPSPASPVMPQGTGDKTANLFDESTIQQGYYGTATNYNVFTADNKYRSFTKNLKAGTYTLNITADETMYILRCNNDIDGSINVYSNPPYTFTLSADTTIYVSWRDTNTTNSFTNMAVMLNEGETAIPYEPFGVKIPISSTGQTTPVYLGEVESTRKIKKLVLDGTENWRQSANGAMYLSPFTGGSYKKYKKEVAITSMNSHFAAQINTTSGTNQVEDNSSCFLAASGSAEYYIGARSYATAADFKTYLAQQYTAGTPVTVWYVLATEETGIVNEPLMRIGDYADEVSGITIPVTAGGDTLSVGTTVQPSEVTVNYKGWHTVQNVHERNNGVWT